MTSYSYETSKNAAHFTNTVRTVRGITIHHWGSTGSAFDNIVTYLCSRRDAHPTSAHYVAQGADANGHPAPRVACIVDPDLIAWHAGNWQANVDTIGIECRPEAREADYVVVAELVARLQITYGLDLPIYPHSHWTNTACPGKWDLSKLHTMAHAAQKGLEAPVGTAPPVTPPTNTAVVTHVSLTTFAMGVPKGQAITLNAYVSPPGATGSLEYQWLRAGVWTKFATETVTAATGYSAHTNMPAYTAAYRTVFVPTDSTKFRATTSSTLSVSVTDIGELDARLRKLGG